MQNLFWPYSTKKRVLSLCLFSINLYVIAKYWVIHQTQSYGKKCLCMISFHWPNETGEERHIDVYVLENEREWERPSSGDELIWIEIDVINKIPNKIYNERRRRRKSLLPNEKLMNKLQFNEKQLRMKNSQQCVEKNEKHKKVHFYFLVCVISNCTINHCSKNNCNLEPFLYNKMIRNILFKHSNVHANQINIRCYTWTCELHEIKSEH